MARGWLPALAVAASLAGCVTTAGIVKGDQTTKPMFFGGVAADLVVTGVIAWQVESVSAAGTIATALAVTAVDVGVGCLLGSCASLKAW
jgi:hypothetical protein